MKYNEELFNISSNYYFSIDKEVDQVDERTACLERELLAILLQRFKELLNGSSTKQNGVLKTKFVSRFYGDIDDGYNQISELISLGKFDSFANQYCLYLGNVETREDESFNSYYEIIWDYRTYFESLSMHEIAKDLEVKGNSKDQSKMAEAISSFRNLPVKNQLSVMQSFIAKVKKECALKRRQTIEAECASKGHDFSGWSQINYSTFEKNPYLGSRDYIVPRGMERISVEHTKWERVCSRCGYVETVEQEPQELIDKRKRKERMARIKKLESELERLKKNNLCI